MLADERFSKIVELVNKAGFVSTKALALAFHVTETTIRRDCEELEQQGLLIRVHGGAKSIRQSEILSPKDETVMKERFDVYPKEKEAICKKAASFVRDGDCIFLDGGTSILPILKYLKGRKIKIVTHSTLIANAFCDEDAELFVIGGKYMAEYDMLVGPVTLDNLSRFNFDYAFLSCAGIDLKRRLVYTAEMDTMAVKQKAMQLAVKKYLLADASKLFIRGFCSFINSDDFDAVICNADDRIAEEELADNYIIVNKEKEEL